MLCLSGTISFIGFCGSWLNISSIRLRDVISAAGSRTCFASAQKASRIRKFFHKALSKNLGKLRPAPRKSRFDGKVLWDCGLSGLLGVSTYSLHCSFFFGVSRFYD